MDSVEAIRQEGEAMHHCVFTNEYYLKADSLILSAETDEGEHVPYTETNDSIKIGAAKAARKNKIE